ncbi:MAG: hypothetical protein ACOYOA_05495 [Saprospiraceae bacterium]
MKFILLKYSFLIVFVWASCKSIYSSKNGCNNVFNELSQIIRPLTYNNDVQIYQIIYSSKDSIKQLNELENLTKEFLFPNRYKCLIGIDIKQIIKCLGKPSNDYKKNRQHSICYWIRHAKFCGDKAENHGDVLFDNSYGCYILEFSFDDNMKVTDMALN